MSNTYYTSLSGMLAASLGLQNTSNNMANMQSPGFKRSSLFYSSLGYGANDEGLGSGVYLSGKVTNFSDGKHLPTSNPTDLAIVGQGFFVIRFKSGELLYTRNGEFGFDNDGVLVDKRSGGQVQGYDSAGHLVAIHEKGPKTAKGKPSHEIFLNGKWIRKEKSETEQNQPGPFKNKYEDVKFEVMKVYDDQGKAHTIKLEFQSTPVLVNGDNTTIPDNGTSWDLLRATCDDADIQCSNGQQIIFSGKDTTTTESHNSIRFMLNGTQEIVLRFGKLGDGQDSCVELKDSALNPEGTQIKAHQNDGYGEGKQIDLSFDEDGQISYLYDNGQTITGLKVCLARFDDLEHTLIQRSDNLFRAKQDKGRHLGPPNQNGFGSIQSKQIESANVDSTTEFANIVVLQRMFQACSQLMDIDKQLVQELLNK